MSKVRVYEVARELGLNNKELVAMFQSLGFAEVRNHMSAVEADVVERVRRKLERKSEPEVVEERLNSTVVKRRSRGGDVRVERRAEASAPAAAPASLRGPAPSAPSSLRAPTPSAPSSHRAPAAPASVRGRPSEPSRRGASAPALDGAERAPASVPSRPAPSRPAPSRPSQPEVQPPAPSVPAIEPARAADTMEMPPPSLPTPPEVPAPPPVEPPVSVKEPAAPPVTPRPPAKTDEPPAEPGARRRPTTPPKSGIEVWEGRPGVPMPQRPRTPPVPGGPQARRTTYDPRANAAQQRGGPYGGYGQRPIPGRPMRPQFRRGPTGYNQRQRRGPVEVSTKQMADHKKVIKIEGETSLQTLAGRMSLKATDVLMRLLGMGMTGVNINSTLDSDTAKLLAGEFGWTVEDVSIDVEEELEAATQQDEGEEGESVPRPPIVTVMGHVDHGKTTLLDTIRKATVAAGEAGGITQHIGAYRVETKKGTICFLDTPGHEAFTAMRARGARLTDIVILVVAADDGVMPQTREAINHARSAKVPIIVAVNKIDKPGIDAERIMRDLSTEGLQPEDWGGETIFVRVSGKTGEGVEQLLEMVLLQAEVLELRAQPSKRASGVVIEAMLDRGRGPVARVLVQDGTLHRSDVLLAGSAYGKIRAMIDEKGRDLREAGPATPVEVLGLNEVPDAGDPVHAVKDPKVAEALADERRKKNTKSTSADAARFTLDKLASVLSEGEQFELKVIIKADVQGSVEAVSQALNKLSTDRVKLVVVHTGVGGITESDVNLAVASRGAIIIGFNVRPAGKARKFAEQEGVEIRLYDVIYEAIDDVRSAMEGLLPAKKVEKELGKAEVRQVFRISKVGAVAGCMVIDGIVKRSAEVRLVRDSVVVWSGKLASLKRFKDDAREVREGLECGISLEGFNDVKEGDIVEAFEIEEIKATLN
jgi:translation initiation factor IF-2